MLTDSVASDAYTTFAEVYDRFMENVPYDKWEQFIHEILKGEKLNNGLILDMGCGTGEMTRRLMGLGYEMIGVDSSAEMLFEAKSKGGDILYLCQDMREFELYGTVSAVVSVCDCINYITEPDDLLTVFRLVNNYLEAGGLFIFDINSPYKYEELLADNVFAEDAGDAAFIWDNIYDEESRINEYGLTLFTLNEQGSFDKSFELHYERSYTVAEIKALLERAGMEFVAAYGDYEDRAVSETDERIVIVAREKYQDGKSYV